MACCPSLSLVLVVLSCISHIAGAPVLCIAASGACHISRQHCSHRQRAAPALGNTTQHSMVDLAPHPGLACSCSSGQISSACFAGGKILIAAHRALCCSTSRTVLPRRNGCRSLQHALTLYYTHHTCCLCALQRHCACQRLALPLVG